MSATEQETLTKLRLHLYAGKDSTPAVATTRGRKVKLDDLADFLRQYPNAQLPKGKPMFCTRCGRAFEGGVFRACYSVGWLCVYCYKSLALAPVCTRCIVCKNVIRLDDWRYKLWDVVDVEGGIRAWYVHQECEKVLTLGKAA